MIDQDKKIAHVPDAKGLTELERLRGEILFLKRKTKIHVNLVNKGTVNLLTPDQVLTKKQSADIQMLTMQPQWKAFEYWFMLNAKMLYEESAASGQNEAYIMCRLAKCLIDMINAARAITEEKEQKEESDAFDMKQREEMVTDPHGDLPLGEALLDE